MSLVPITVGEQLIPGTHDPVPVQAAILIDRADNNGSRRLESKQDTLKSRDEMEAEAPGPTAALFSLVG